MPTVNAVGALRLYNLPPLEYTDEVVCYWSPCGRYLWAVQRKGIFIITDPGLPAQSLQRVDLKAVTDVAFRPIGFRESSITSENPSAAPAAFEDCFEVALVRSIGTNRITRHRLVKDFPEETDLRCIAQLPIAYPTAVAITNDGEWLAYADKYGKVRLMYLKADTDELAHKIEVNMNLPPNTVAKRLAFGYYDQGKDAQWLFCVTESGIVLGKRGHVHCNLSPMDKILEDANYQSLGTHPNRALAAFGTLDGRVTLFDHWNSSQLRRHTFDAQIGGPARSIQFFPDATNFVVIGENVATLWQFEDQFRLVDNSGAKLPTLKPPALVDRIEVACGFTLSCCQKVKDQLLIACVPW